MQSRGSNPTPRTRRVIQWCLVPNKEKILQYAWHLKKEGYRESTIVSRVKLLNGLSRRADLNNPEAVKGAIARLDVSEARKENLVCVYASFCKLNNIPFSPPRYQRVERLPALGNVQAWLDGSLIYNAPDPFPSGQQFIP